MSSYELKSTDVASLLTEYLAVEECVSTYDYFSRLCDHALSLDDYPTSALHAEFMSLFTTKKFTYTGDGKAVMNLAAFIAEPISKAAIIDRVSLEYDLYYVLRLLDNLAMTHDSPKLKVVGLADALIMLGKNYDSEEGRNAAKRLIKLVRMYAVQASTRLAMERGPQLNVDVDAFLSSHMASHLPKDIVRNIERFGMRFTQIVEVEETPMAALCFFDGTSPGILPVLGEVYYWPFVNQANQLLLVKAECGLVTRFGSSCLHGNVQASQSNTSYKLMKDALNPLLDRPIKPMPYLSHQYLVLAD